MSEEQAIQAKALALRRQHGARLAELARVARDAFAELDAMDNVMHAEMVAEFGDDYEWYAEVRLAPCRSIRQQQAEDGDIPVRMPGFSDATRLAQIALDAILWSLGP